MVSLWSFRSGLHLLGDTNWGEQLATAIAAAFRTDTQRRSLSTSRRASLQETRRTVVAGSQCSAGPEWSDTLADMEGVRCSGIGNPLQHNMEMRVRQQDRNALPPAGVDN